MAKDTDSIENECLFEIRFKPDPKLLDHRGRWAERISEHMKLDKWSISENRIDVFSEDRKSVAFLGFRNAGMVLSNVRSKDYFQNYTRNFLTFVLALESFGNRIFVERLGVRCKFADGFGGTFESLRNRFAMRYVRITDDGQAAIGDDAEIVDIGAPINFKDQVGTFNTMCGPMAQSQFPDFFDRKGTFPSVGLFYDIDYFELSKRNYECEALIARIGEFFSAGWDRHKRIRDLIIQGSHGKRL